ncbi:peptidase of plants and bacteria-domain-containing protein [Microdochium bolleyi]|uniref:Peptidase of plants and bacteria-domain-containing protein n=1 Tax=Microdochium bolleyi TaxID=196109 RepID=A0A136J5D2_9PEZI|nr:peptidase of plants and bacteria-domain-containing protein [Microdochium bolleyi]
MSRSSHSGDQSIPHTAALDIEIDTRRSRKDLDPDLMGIPPRSTPVPPPVFMPGMSPASSAPPAEATATPLPIRAASSGHHDEDAGAADSDIALPKLRLRIDDISHPGAAVFLSHYDAARDFEHCVRSVLRHLYYISPPVQKHLHQPPTRSVTLILRDMPGVAYTTGSDLDDDHKEIHFSLAYIAGVQPSARRHAEIMGVVTHELVHCYQWNARGSCPGGLIEGVADWVRLQCELAPPHWKRGEGTGDDGKWDAGYQRTAYFLDYLEQRFGKGTVRQLNEKLRVTKKYEAKGFWTELVGRPVENLWEDYREALKKEKDDGTRDGVDVKTCEQGAVPTATQA